MIHKLMPRAYINKIEILLIYSGSKKSPENFVKRAFLISIIFAALGGVIFWQNFIVAFPVVFIAMFSLVHGFLILAVDKRSKFVERIFPDALQLMAANIKSGFIPSRAMLLSARKEFGPLSQAVKRAGKELMTGKGLQESLSEIPKTIKSDVLQTTIGLVTKGIKAGGQLVSLFEETAIDIRRRDSIKKEVKANILMYGIFIGFAGCVGAPILYALSSYLVGTISRLGSAAQIPQEFQSRVPMMAFGQMQIDEGFLFIFSMAAILITTTFGGLIIGIIDAGKERAGIKYIPIMIAIALTVFFAARIGISVMFGTLIPNP
jgi:pilus assembly protein TadC